MFVFYKGRNWNFPNGWDPLSKQVGSTVLYIHEGRFETNCHSQEALTYLSSLLGMFSKTTMVNEPLERCVLYLISLQYMLRHKVSFGDISRQGIQKQRDARSKQQYYWAKFSMCLSEFRYWVLLRSVINWPKALLRPVLNPTF